MECKVDEAMIQQYLDGELERLEKIIIEEHIKVCKKCRQELTELKLLMFELGNLEEVTVTDDAKRIRERVVSDMTSSSANTSFSLIKIVNTQRTIAKNSRFYLNFVPGTDLVGNSIKKVPSILQKAADLAFTGTRKLVIARARA